MLRQNLLVSSLVIRLNVCAPLQICPVSHLQCVWFVPSVGCPNWHTAFELSKYSQCKRIHPSEFSITTGNYLKNLWRLAFFQKFITIRLFTVLSITKRTPSLILASRHFLHFFTLTIQVHLAVFLAPRIFALACEFLLAGILDGAHSNLRALLLAGPHSLIGCFSHAPCYSRKILHPHSPGYARILLARNYSPFPEIVWILPKGCSSSPTVLWEQTRNFEI